MPTKCHAANVKKPRQNGNAAGRNGSTPDLVGLLSNTSAHAIARPTDRIAPTAR